MTTPATTGGRAPSIQDWYLRYGLQQVPGVAEVARVGGYVKQYQVILDPVKLLGFGVTADQVIRAIPRLARYCARHPVALSRLAYQADSGTVTYQSDKVSGPTAGAETVDALEFLARVVSHIPNKGQVLQRYCVAR